MVWAVVCSGQACMEADRIGENDLIEIDHRAGIIKNITKNETYDCTKIPEHLIRLMDAGGLIGYLKERS